MRLIDADKLVFNTVGLCDAQENFLGVAKVVFAEDVEQAPTVDIEKLKAGPNDPLTLDELREMDGDWAWIEGPEHPGQWVKIMYVGGTYRMVRISFFVGETADAEVLMLFHGAKLYRRKPEEVKAT